MNCCHSSYCPFHNKPFDKLKDLPACSQGDHKRIKDTDDSLTPMIYGEYLDDFLQLEMGLIERGFLDPEMRWLKSKRMLLDLIAVLNKNHFLKQYKGKQYKHLHYRHFIELRYGLSSGSLTNSANKYKPDFITAKSTFHWHGF